MSGGAAKQSAAPLKTHGALVAGEYRITGWEPEHNYKPASDRPVV